MTGLGSIGQRHVRNLKQILGPEAEFIAHRVRGNDIVIDRNLDATFGRSPEDHYQIRTFPSLDAALLENPDVVFVTNPIAFHIDTALAAARHGAHLFIEKPVSDRWAGIDELLTVVQEKKLVAGVGYQLRFHPGLKMVRQALQGNRIGRICSAHLHWGEYMPGMRTYEDYRQKHEGRRSEGGGVILCLSHEIDYACWLFGVPTRVFASGGHLSAMEIDVEDTASLLLECPLEGRSVPVHIYLDFVQRPPSRTCKIVGEEGTILWNYFEQSFALYDARTDHWERQAFEDFDRNSMFVDEVESFLASVTSPTSTPEAQHASLEDGVATLHTALAARTSLEERRVVDLV